MSLLKRKEKDVKRNVTTEGEIVSSGETTNQEQELKDCEVAKAEESEDYQPNYNQSIKLQCIQLWNTINDYIEGDVDNSIYVGPQVSEDLNVYGSIKIGISSQICGFDSALTGICEALNEKFKQDNLNYNTLVDCVYTCMRESLKVLLVATDAGLVSKSVLEDIRAALGYILECNIFDQCTADQCNASGVNILLLESMLADISNVMGYELIEAAEMNDFNRIKTIDVMVDLNNVRVQALHSITCLREYQQLVAKDASIDENCQPWLLVTGKAKDMAKCDDDDDDEEHECNCKDCDADVDVIGGESPVQQNLSLLVRAMIDSAKHTLNQLTGLSEQLTQDELAAEIDHE